MLNEFQKRRLSITITGIEEDLYDIEECLKSQDYHGVLYEIRNDIPMTTRDAMIANIMLIRKGISSLAEQFGLRGETRMLSRKISSKLSILWVSLEETKARRLTGYGEVTAGLHDLLDPALDEIIALFEEIRQALRNV